MDVKCKICVWRKQISAGSVTSLDISNDSRVERFFCASVSAYAMLRVTTCLENLEMSGSLTAVGDFTENQGIVREKILSGKSCLKLFIVNCIPVSIHAFSRSLLCLKCLVYGFRSCAVAFLHPPLTVTLVRHDMSNT